MLNVLTNISAHPPVNAQRSKVLYAAIICYALCVLWLDVRFRFGITVGIPYLFAVWIAYRTASTRVIWMTAAGTSLFALAGVLVFKPDGELTFIIINRSLAIIAIWGTALLCWQIRMTQENLAEREQQVHQIIESAPTAMLMTDIQGTIVLTNAEALRLFGYASHELIGQPVDILVPERLRSKHPAMRAAFTAKPTARAMGAGRDLHAVRKDGSEVSVEIGLTPISHQDTPFILSAIVDISQRKALEDSLRTLNVELEQRVADRTAELLQANDALVRSNVELQQFAYIASHDLQTPLRGISGFVQLLSREYGDKLDPQARRWIERTVDNTQRMHVLINDLLSYSRVDSRARPFEPVELDKIVDEARQMLASDTHHANVSITHDPLPCVLGDPSQLTQMLENLIGNGIKYNTSAQPQVHISARQVDSEWIITVTDNGIGVAPEYQEQIFEIFKRLHTNQAYPGTGIGLAVCRRVVHRHHGRIWLDSEPGKGSSFHFTIPLRENDTDHEHTAD